MSRKLSYIWLPVTGTPANIYWPDPGSRTTAYRPTYPVYRLFAAAGTHPLPLPNSIGGNPHITGSAIFISHQHHRCRPRVVARLDLSTGQHLFYADFLLFNLLGDIRLGAHRIGGLSPVSMVCSAASVCPVRAEPGMGKRSTNSNNVLASWLFCKLSRSLDVRSSSPCKCSGKVNISVHSTVAQTYHICARHIYM